MTVSPIGATPGITSALAATGTPASTDGGASFGNVLAGVVQNVQSTQTSANDLAVKAVTGDLTDIHQATIAATRAQVTLEVVAAVRDKGIAAFNEIMRMQA